MIAPHDPFAPETRDNPQGFRTRELTARAERVGDDDSAPLRMAISSEAPVERYDWRTGEIYDEVLSHRGVGPDLSYVADGVPFCLDHSLAKQIGIGTTPSVDGDGVARIDVARGNHPDAEWVFKDMASGIRKKVSIGYWPGERYTQTKTAAGRIVRTYEGWALYEASSVAVPADYSVGVGRSAFGAAPVQQAESDPALSMESQMSLETTSERGTAPTPDTRAAELAVLARDGGMPEKAAEWIVNGVAVDAARSEVLASLRAKAEQRAPISTAPAVAVVGTDRAEDKPFTSLVDQLRAIKRAADGHVDPRLHGVMRGAASGLNETVGADGGYLIAPQFATEIFRLANAGGEILSRVKEIPVSGNQYTIPAVDETSRTNGNRWGGVRAFRAGENDTATASRPKFRRVTLDLTKKLIAIGYVTEEQLEDAPATSVILTEAFSEEIRFAKEREIWEGNGVGEMLGFMNSGALVSQAAESGQTATTINAANIVKMYSRLLPAARANAVWFINQDAEPQLPLMTIGNWPVFVPPSGLSGSKYGTLYNRPVVAVEFASTLGTLGDIVLADLSYYAMGTKGGANMQRSIHVRFVQGEETFRITDRCDGQPMLAAAVTPFKGSATQSAFVALAAR